MNIGAARITLRIPHSRSLKDKRRVVNSLRQRVGSKFNVSIAEVEMNDAWQTLTLGIACVSNSALSTPRRWLTGSWSSSSPNALTPRWWTAR